MTEECNILDDNEDHHDMDDSDPVLRVCNRCGWLSPEWEV